MSQVTPGPEAGPSVQDRLVKVLSDNGQPMTRSQIVDVTGIPRTTVYDNMKKLLAEREVRSFREEERCGRGRPRIFYSRVVRGQ